MGIEDLVNQGKQLFEDNKDKVQGLLKSDQAEDISDKVLDAGADLAKKVLPDEHDAKVDGVRDSIDGAIGNQ
ncbi:Rv0909 family putative TA system antitoxin [Microbacterium sp. BWT-B31]|uniref:Rv0909 family putative TA system antitoxin n=1 Tax=Microbacterium sp. BWT-B31 TaxID=3232072 RepID=UPI0035288337